MTDFANIWFQPTVDLLFARTARDVDTIHMLEKQKEFDKNEYKYNLRDGLRCRPYLRVRRPVLRSDFKGRIRIWHITQKKQF